jgi:uncharacterized protein affecting Mg2+/Co2+ transport
MPRKIKITIHIVMDYYFYIIFFGEHSSPKNRHYLVAARLLVNNYNNNINSLLSRWDVICIFNNQKKYSQKPCIY